MMVELEPPLRRATAADAPALAELIDMAGEGLPSVIWRRMAPPGEDPWALGRRLQARKAEEGKAIVVDEGRGAVAALMGYPIAPAPVAIADDEEPMFRPLIELENLALATWYVNVLAAYPQERRRGHATRLLALAERLARGHGLAATSIIVADRNAGARRLYERIGYSETARRPMVKDGWQSDSSEWVLLIKRL